METGNPAEKEFRIMIVKMIQDIGKTIEKMQEVFTKDLQELKNKQRWIIHQKESTAEYLRWGMDKWSREQNGGKHRFRTQYRKKNGKKKKKDCLRDLFSESHSVMSDSLWPHGLHSPWNSLGQNTGEGSLSLLPTQVSRIAGGFFTSWATREAQETSGTTLNSPTFAL